MLIIGLVIFISSAADKFNTPPAWAVISLWHVILVSPSTSIFASLPTNMLHAPLIEISA